MRFHKGMKEGLSEKEKDREAHRGYIMGLAGFSFSGLLALVLLDAVLRKGYLLSIYYLFMSFLAYLFALNMQSYKEKRWQDQLATASTDLASLCLILSIIGILLTQGFSHTFALWLSIVAISIWFVDHVFRISIVWKFLREKEKPDGRGKGQKEAEREERT